MPIYRNAEGLHGLESLGTPGLVKIAFFIQRCCDPVHFTFCSAEILIFRGCEVFVSGLVTV